VSARIVVARPARFEAMQWTPSTDPANAGRMIAWVEIRTRFGSHLAGGIGAPHVLMIETQDGDLPVEPGGWLVFDPIRLTVRVVTDQRYRDEYEEITP